MCYRGLLIAGLCLLLAAAAGATDNLSQKAELSTRSDNDQISLHGYPCESDLIEILFDRDSRVRLRDKNLVDLSGSALEGVDEILQRLDTYSWSRICNLPESRLDEIHARGQNKSGRQLYNMNNIYRLRFTGKIDIWELCRQMEALPGIMTARPVPLPPPVPAVGNYEWQQRYLDSAGSTPTGIDAELAWTVPGGTGAGIAICDIEYGWNYNHADLTKAQNSQINPETIALPPGETNDHGTAVIGEMISDNNGWGTTGICYDATLYTCGAYYGSPLAFNPAGAIAYAIDSLSAGDIILLELQWDYNDTGTPYTDFIPIEWYTDTFPNAQTYNAVYIAIENAIANGIHVVEAGGNGGAPTPNSGYNTGALTWYGHSGAVIVGAGGAYPGGTYPAGDLERIYWSSYGPRYDLQGWGEDVVTTGYGYLYSSTTPDTLYTDVFAGTSSASPIVAGAIACCMSYAQAQGWIVDSLTPSKVRDVLWATGTAQIMGPTGNIGPRPNLKKAFDSLSSFTDATFYALRYTSRSTVGIAWADYDNDNDLDFYLSNYFMPNNLYQNDGYGNFTDVAVSPENDNDPGRGVAWGDYDNDGHLDLYLVKFSIQGANHANSLLHNNGDGTFTDATPAILADTGYSYGMAWGDYDLDGDIDLFYTSDTYYGQGSKLMRNDGGGNFTDVTSTAITLSGNQHTDILWGDYNNDGYDDLYITTLGGSERNYLFRNNGDGTFTDLPGSAVALYTSTYCASWGDYNNDGFLDLFVGGLNNGNYLFHNNGDGTFTDVAASPLSDVGPTVDAAWGDYDNDMDLDIYLVNDRDFNKLLRNDGGGVFTDVTVPWLALNDTVIAYSAAWGDYDADGDIDLLTSGHEIWSDYLLRNRVGANNNWLHVDLVGTNCNYYGIGARIRVVAGGISQVREVFGGSNLSSQNSLTAEFGLGSYTMADTVEITWPTTAKAVTIKTNVSANQTITVHEVMDFVCGDANGDQAVNILDITYLIAFLYQGGPAPDPYEAGDANGDDTINILDITYLIAFLYQGGPDPIC